MNASPDSRRAIRGLLVAGFGLLAGSQACAEVFRVREATIAEIQKALDDGALSAVELAVLSMNRVEAYDRSGIRLNAVPVLNPGFLAEALEADRRRARGDRTPLLGVPYTVKDSYKVRGLTVAAGSPAFAKLVANEDAFTVSEIRAAGGVLIGKTNMPPLANGGMQRGVYGRAESPYNAAYLTAAWASGSSNGSATATAASLATFGMGEETVSSGRSPASNNGLVAYTPSRGLISIRGNWPLFPVRDVVVPHARTVSDLFSVLDVVVKDDPVTEGDFWRNQRVVPLPTVASLRPASFQSLANRNALRGKRFGVPTMYLGKDREMRNPITVRPSILALWERAAPDLRAAGAEVVEIDFTPMHEYDADRSGASTLSQRGLIPANWWFNFGPGAPRNAEMFDLAPWGYETFLRSNKDAALPSWSVVDAAQVFPDPPGSVEAKGKGLPHGYAEVKAAIVAGVTPPESLPNFSEALRAIERLRGTLFEEWLAKNGLDGIVFPANADVGKADSDVNEESYADANRNGVFFSNMNHMIRHLGIPSVSVTMGVMSDTDMPVNLTFAGRGYDDLSLLGYAYAYEQASRRRVPAPRTPELDDEVIEYRAADVLPPTKRPETTVPELSIAQFVRLRSGGLRISGTARDPGGIARVTAYVNGRKVGTSGSTRWRFDVPAGSPGIGAASAGSAVTVTVVARDRYGNAAAVQQHLTQ